MNAEMPDLDVQELMKRRSEIMDLLSRRVTEVTSEIVTDPEAGVRHLTAQIEEARKALEALTTARATEVKRFDDAIARVEERLKRFEEELNGERKELDRIMGEAQRGPTKAKRATPVKAPRKVP